MKIDNEAETTSVETPATDTPAPSEQPGADANGESSTPNPDEQAESSPAKGVKHESLGDAISKALGPLEEDEEREAPAVTPPEEEAESGDPEGEAKAKETAEEPAKEDPADAKTDKPRGAQERIRELVAEKKALQRDLDELKRYTGSEQGFTNFKTLVKSFAETPEDAVPLLEQLLADARDRAGLVVRDADVKQRLEDGLVDEPTAKELQQLRVLEKRRKAELERGEQERRTMALASAVHTWEKNVRSRTPDYDRVADRVMAEAKLMAYENPPQTPEEAVAIAQKAYENVTKWVRGMLPARAPAKVQASSGSAAKATPRPKSIHDLVDRVL